jgi:hypothetical protein
MCLHAERIIEKRIPLEERHFACMHWQEIRIKPESER